MKKAFYQVAASRTPWPWAGGGLEMIREAAALSQGVASCLESTSKVMNQCITVYLCGAFFTENSIRCWKQFLLTSGLDLCIICDSWARLEGKGVGAEESCGENTITVTAQKISYFFFGKAY